MRELENVPANGLEDRTPQRSSNLAKTDYRSNIARGEHIGRRGEDIGRPALMRRGCKTEQPHCNPDGVRVPPATTIGTTRQAQVSIAASRAVLERHAQVGITARQPSAKDAADCRAH